MNGTPMGARLTKRWASAAVVIGSTVAVMASPLAIGTASAAAGAVTITAGANSNQPAGAASTAVVTATYTPTSSVTPLYFTVTGGPDTPAVNLQGTACTPNPPAGGGPVTCTIHNNGTAGVDQVIVFADNDSSGSFSGGDASATTSVTFSGAPNTVTINPARFPGSHAVSTEANSCEVYKVTAFDSAPRPAGARGVLVSLSETVSGATPAPTFALFNVDSHGKCSTGVAVLAPTYNAATHTETGGQYFATGDDGSFQFGLTTTQPGTGSVTATSVDTPAAHDADSVIWGPGGAGAVVTVNATPTSSTGYTGTTATYTVKVADSGGNPVQGVSVSAQETSGPGANVTCANPTDQDGAVTCSIVNTGGAGLVTAKFYVEDNVAFQCVGGNTANADSCEPQTTVTAQFDAIPAYNAHSLTCVQQLNNAQQGTGVTSCTVPLQPSSRASNAAAPSNEVVWPSWPQACITPGFEEA